MKIKREQLKESVAELSYLATNPTMNINSEEVKNSIFYSAIQEETNLDLRSRYDPGFIINPTTMVLLAQIAATSPLLHTINMRGYYLRGYGIAVAKALAKSLSLHTLNMSENELGEYAPATAEALAESQSLCTLNMSENKLGVHGIAVAKALAKSQSIHTLNMSQNWLGVHGIAVAKALVTLQSLNSICMSSNVLYNHGSEVATVFAQSHSLHKVSMVYNGLGEYGSTIAAAFAKSQSIHTIHIKFNQLKECALESINTTTTRNIKSLQNFANKLIKTNLTSDVLYVSDLQRLKFCDKNLLTELMENNVELVTKLINVCLSPKYFAYNAFEIMGVCKNLTLTDPANKEVGLCHMSPEIICMINSFLSPEDWYLPALDVAGDFEAQTWYEPCLLM